MKIGAGEIVGNLRWSNETSMIPSGALVYIATDDPDGVCAGCTDAAYKPCSQFKPPNLPSGCIEDVRVSFRSVFILLVKYVCNMCL